MKDIIETVLSVWEKSIDLLKKPLGLPVLIAILLIASYFLERTKEKTVIHRQKKMTV